ncbi:MAG TPA: rhodanese-like domain-containing protein [Thermosynechococcaceae cyanobacterium]
MNSNQAKGLILGLTLLSLLGPRVKAEDIPNPSSTQISNPQIDIKAHLRISSEAASYRENRRLSEAQFLKMAALPGTIVLDARSKSKFDLLHIKGAINLSFPDIDIKSLQETIPDKNTRILIYCNNNFSNAPEAFPTKSAPPSLNISTFITLYSYGYRNIYELGPFLDAQTTKILLVSSQASKN